MIAIVSLFRWTTKQMSGWWRTWTPWMTMLPPCWTSPPISLCLSFGRTVSSCKWMLAVVTQESAAPGYIAWCGNCFMLASSSYFAFHSAFFLFLLSGLWTYVFTFFSNPIRSSFVRPHFVCHLFSKFLWLGLRGTELSESLFLSTFSYSTLRLRWHGFFSIHLVFPLFIPVMCSLI